MEPDSDDGLNIIYSVMQGWKDKILDQVEEINNSFSEYVQKNRKDTYPEILFIQQKNRESLLILIEIQQLYEIYSFRIPNEKINNLEQQFLSLNFDEFPYIHVKGRVNKRQTLQELVKNDDNLYSRLNKYSDIIKVQYDELLKEKIILENERKQCTERKDKKNLNDRIYRKDLNVQFFKILNDTLLNLKYIRFYIQSVQQQVDITQFIRQEDIDYQTHASINHELYIRSSLKEGRRDKRYIKIVMFSIAILFITGQNCGIYPETNVWPNMEIQKKYPNTKDQTKKDDSQNKKQNQYVQGQNSDEEDKKYQPFKQVILQYLQRNYTISEIQEYILQQEIQNSNQYFDIQNDQKSNQDNMREKEKSDKYLVKSEYFALDNVIQVLDQLDKLKNITVIIKSSILEENIKKVDDIFNKYNNQIKEILDSEWVLDHRNKNYNEYIQRSCENIYIELVDEKKQNENTTKCFIDRLKILCQVIYQEKRLIKFYNQGDKSLVL